MSVTPLLMPTRRPVPLALPVRLAYTSTTGDRPRTAPAPVFESSGCAGCDGEISKSQAVLLWGCIWCGL